MFKKKISIWPLWFLFISKILSRILFSPSSWFTRFLFTTHNRLVNAAVVIFSLSTGGVDSATKDKEPPERWLFWNTLRRSLRKEAYLDSRMETVENIAWWMLLWVVQLDRGTWWGEGQVPFPTLSSHTLNRFNQFYSWVWCYSLSTNIENIICTPCKYVQANRKPIRLLPNSIVHNTFHPALRECKMGNY